ncbi:MAG TPA: hypothetical protein VMV92_36150 [Streptosporangiaceae bacterium]|nr:hypothetical protein [Streptosporangiaceae bacterium]
MGKRWARLCALVGSLIVVIATATGSSLAASAAATQAGAASSSAGVKPNATGMMDCNGHSTVYKDVKQDLGGLCTDPLGYWDGSAWRFEDNGSYVGHDEPSVKFISTASGSGNNMTYVNRLGTDPAGKPTVSPNGKTVSDYAELSPAPWFGLPICDPRSYPENPCKPDSDANSGAISDPNSAGSAFMELQFYPPGYQPFVDGISCDPTHWCAALTIDSLESQFNFVNLNPACTEPVNFAFLQRNGVPAGPPSPQLTDVSTFTPNKETLMMNPGDTVVTSIHDTSQGLLTSVTDLTTHRTGYMVASGKNGFMNTNYQTCAGTPFNFHPEYNTARQQNQVPWAALEGGVLMQQEIGHFEPCSSITNSQPYNVSFGDGQSFSDPTTAQTCVGGFEGAGKTGEGPCNISTGVCQNATTQGGGACASNNFTSGSLCEFSDMTCVPAGPRPVNVNGTAEKLGWPVAGCQDSFYQNGDLDFDGSSYIHDWPDGSPNHPTSFAYMGPFSHGRSYPNIQFETDVAGSENNCDIATGTGCTAPPAGARFYPFWSLGHGSGAGCVWNFGDNIAGQTVRNFGGDAQYGTPDIARFGGTLTSPVLSNPQAACGSSAGKQLGGA